MKNNFQLLSVKVLFKYVFQAGLAGVLTIGSSIAFADAYELDSNHTNVRFSIDHFGTSTNQGGFYNLQGTLKFNPNSKEGFIDLDIPIETLSTGNSHFDNHLKSADFFDIEKYKTAHFKSTKWYFTKDDKVIQIDGDLTLLGKTHPISLKAVRFNCYDSPILKKQVCGGDFKTQIDRTQWGMNTYADMAKMVNLNIQVEAAKQDEKNHKMIKIH